MEFFCPVYLIAITSDSWDTCTTNLKVIILETWENLKKIPVFKNF